MLPALRAGDLVVGLRWFRPRPGLIVVVTAPGGRAIKRLIREEDGRWWLEGDNAPLSTDSRQWGAFSRRNLEARLLLRLRG